MFDFHPKILECTSAAEFQRLARQALLMLASDLCLDDPEVTIYPMAHVTISPVDPRSTVVGLMGSVSLTTETLKIEVYVDAYAVRPCPRMLYRDRFCSEGPRSVWLTDLSVTERGRILRDLWRLNRDARPAFAQRKPPETILSRLAGLFS